MDAVKLHIRKFNQYMRWQMLGEIYADDSWNKEKLANFDKKHMN
ncbi:hypothetical protein [Lactobacillus helveticus]|nr:hypothetical protein [Lactobacillus helveticus]NRO27359.1 hypothetical protein [Lactobacillus helveticus]NRO37550.1 hypothetical protein [Lactobacillus helveticus]